MYILLGTYSNKTNLYLNEGSQTKTLVVGQVKSSLAN